MLPPFAQELLRVVPTTLKGTEADVYAAIAVGVITLVIGAVIAYVTLRSLNFLWRLFCALCALSVVGLVALIGYCFYVSPTNPLHGLSSVWATAISYQRLLLLVGHAAVETQSGLLQTLSSNFTHGGNG